MGKKLRWVTEEYRGMYVHAVAFGIVDLFQEAPPPGPKWSYMVSIRYTQDFDSDMVYGPSSDHSDYFTREAAEQAAIHYGKRAIDITLDLG